MALNLSRAFTYSANNTIASSENNTNENALYSAFSGLEAGTSSMSKLPLDADPSSALHAATKQYVDGFGNYRRPNLVYISATTVDIENNTGTANTTKIVFPDGNARTVTEDTSSTHKYRRFIITATAEFGSGTEDSGLRSGLSEANNTWYAIYAVKSTINTANFVLAGDTTHPSQSNYSTLNSRYGTSGWVFLGYIRNGDQSATAGDILNFRHNGAKTVLMNTCAGNVANSIGVRVASTAGAATLSWTFADGTSADTVPTNIRIASYIFQVAEAAAGAGYLVNNAGSAPVVLNFMANTGTGAAHSLADGPPLDYRITRSTGTAAMDTFLTGWIDPLLIGNYSII